jgi:hypothetical protein
LTHNSIREIWLKNEARFCGEKTLGVMAVKGCWHSEQQHESDTSLWWRRQKPSLDQKPTFRGFPFAANLTWAQLEAAIQQTLSFTVQ